MGKRLRSLEETGCKKMLERWIRARLSDDERSSKCQTKAFKIDFYGSGNPLGDFD